MKNEIVKDDGLFIDEAGPWSERKHRLIAHYAQIFSNSMKINWQCRVYIDLFSSSGYAKIKNSKRIVKTSPLLSLGIKDKFDLYIFTDIDPIKINALETRVKVEFPDLNVEYICNDANSSVGEIFSKMPQFSKSFKVLGFCVVDPYHLDNLSFSTVRDLSQRFMDFLILIPSFMDANRNIITYKQKDNKVVEKFLEYPKWREEWEIAEKKRIQFGNFLLKKFNQQMSKIGFLPVEQDEIVLIRNPNNAPLYHLAFFSKHPLAKKFWKDSKKGTETQLSLF